MFSRNSPRSATGRRRRRGSALRIVGALLLAGSCAASTAVAQKADTEPADESLADWPFFKAVQVPAESDSPWVDVILGPEVFTHAQTDLSDLRLYDAGGADLPYALRVRRPQYRRDRIEATEFNRALGPDDSRELSLDLGEAPVVHNEVEVDLPGKGFRRRVQLEGSDDGTQWKQLAEDRLIRFEVEKESAGEESAAEQAPSRSFLAEDLSLEYPPSRFRYLRLRVYPDPLVDKRPVPIAGARVLHTVEVPGEMLVLEGRLGPREPVRAAGAPASAWIVDLGGENVPVERIEVEVADDEFVRDYRIEVAGPPEEESFINPFRWVHSGTWQRRAGEEPKPMVASFNEVRASRLKLTVIDHRNEPLDIRSVAFSAPARQVVFDRPETKDPAVRLYYGDRDALPPRYDFARNLPDRLDPPPDRGELGPQQENPVYIPPPIPLTERWPWMIYVVLGGVSLVLGALVVNVAGSAISVHDSKEDAARSASGDGGSPEQ